MISRSTFLVTIQSFKMDVVVVVVDVAAVVVAAAMVGDDGIMVLLELLIG